MRESLEKANRFQEDIESNWQAEEVKLLNMSINRIQMEIQSKMKEIDCLVDDIKEVAEQIREEEKRELMAKLADK